MSQFSKAYLLSAAALPFVFTVQAAAADPELPVSANAVETIVVTATGNEQSLEDAPASISVVSRDEIELIGGGDLSDTLAAEPGIMLTGAGMTRQGVSVRGMPESHTLYLIDGMRVSATSGVIAHSDAELGWVPPVAIERVEVVRGPMSALYGSDALGGVVNVITRSPVEERFGEISAGFGSNESEGGDSSRASAYLAAPIVEGRLGASLALNYQNRDDVPDADDPAISEIEGRESQTARAALRWTPNAQHSVDVSYLRGEDDRWRDTRTSGRSPVDYEYTDDIEREQIAAAHAGHWSWGQTRLSLYRSRTDRQNQRSAGQEPTRDQALQDTVADAFAAFDLTDAHKISVGGQWRVEELDDAIAASTGSVNAEQYAVFVQDEFALTDRLSIVGGFRGDRHDGFGWETSPRLYAVYRATDRLTLKGGYGEGFKSPSLTDMSADYEVLAAGGRFWVEGNPDLEPETSESFEVSAAYSGDRWALHVGAFRNEVTNLIETHCYTSCGVRGQERRRYENRAKARIDGIEASMDVLLPAGFSANVNYTYLDTEDEATGEPLAERAHHTANASIGWTASNEATVRVRTEYRGDQDDGSGAVIPDYTLVHLDAEWPVAPQVRLNAGVENIFDERLADRSDLYTFAEPGRVVRASVTYTF